MVEGDPVEASAEDRAPESLFALSPAPAEMPQRRRIERLVEAALAAAETTIVERIRAERGLWVAELKEVVGSDLVTREVLDVELAQLDVRFGVLFEQLAELKAGETDRLVAAARAGLQALQAETAGLFGACSVRLELLERALGEAGRRLQAVEAALAPQQAG
jgi:hypothetical protein